MRGSMQADARQDKPRTHGGVAFAEPEARPFDASRIEPPTGLAAVRPGPAALPLPLGPEGGCQGSGRRAKIYEYVMLHPGAHVRGVAKDLGVATGDLEYHLHWLERNGLVKTRRGGFYKFVYPLKTFGERQEVVLGILSQETPREILLCIIERPGLTQGELAETTRHSQPTVSWHMDRLVQLGIIRRTKEGKSVSYEVVADPGEILEFVRSYHPRVRQKWSARLNGVLHEIDGKRRVA